MMMQVLSSPVPSHLALVQLDRASLEVTFDDVYPLDCGLAATRLRRDVRLSPLAAPCHVFMNQKQNQHHSTCCVVSRRPWRPIRRRVALNLLSPGCDVQLDLAGADDLLVLTCFEWDRTYKQRLLPIAEYLANHGDTTLAETLVRRCPSDRG